MRLDLFLANSRLLKSRSVAKQACEQGRVLVGERPAKASKEVCQGDIVTLDYFNRSVKLRIDRLPWKNMKKSEAPSTYRILLQQKTSPFDFR